MKKLTSWPLIWRLLIDKKTIDDLKDENDKLKRVNAQLRAENIALRTENDRLKEDKEDPMPEMSGNGRVFSRNEVYKILQDAVPYAWSLELLDEEYFVPPIDETIAYVKWNRVNRIRYIPNFFDCENSAFKLAVDMSADTGMNPIFVFWDYKGKHAYCIALDPDGNLWVIEPQADIIDTLEDFDRDMFHVFHDGKVYAF